MTDAQKLITKGKNRGLSPIFLSPIFLPIFLEKLFLQTPRKRYP